jgi:glycosyltransferase involved in cell wall biosynthesis
MSSEHVDLLMITHRRPEYTRLALTRLLAGCDDSMRVWIWHNGSDAETLSEVESLAAHPRVARLHHSPENKKLWEPTNWFWQNATGDYVGKVDDDCLVPEGWASTLRRAHRDVAQLGVIGCWHFRADDFVFDVAAERIQAFGEHRIVRNIWIGGSGYLMKRELLEDNGVLRRGESFTSYCVRSARLGWINGWYFPLLLQDHMDDPRSEHSQLRSDDDLRKWLPLSAERNGVTSLAEWEAQLKRSALIVQTASLDVTVYAGWRQRVRNVRYRVRRLLGDKRQW